MKIKFFVAAVAASVALASCSEPNARINEEFKPETQSGRIKIISAQKWTDNDSRGRDILVLLDTKTGEEYLAVGGCGVSAMSRRGKADAD